MDQKRGIFIVALVLLLLLSSLLVSSEMVARESDDSFIETIFPDENFEYTYALGIEGADDDEASCGTVAHQSGILQQIVQGNQLAVLFPWDLDLEDYEVGATQCIWQNLPLDFPSSMFLPPSQPGCYFFTSEDDDVEWNGNDCSGWFIPPGEQSIIPGIPIASMQTHLFTPSATTEPDSSTISTSSSVTQGFEYIFHDQAGDYLDSEGYNFYNQRSSETIPSDDATCVFESHRFSDPRGFICLEQQNQYRWYICDEEHLFERTGDYIPKAQCYRHADCGEGYECTSENTCVNDAGEEKPEEQNTVWVCDNDIEEGYVWEEYTLSCDDTAAGVDCDNDESLCTTDEFSWLPNAPEGQRCCGDDGLEDFAQQYSSDESGGNFFCANKNLIDTEGDITQLNWGTEQTPCGEWCWINAIGDIAFHILTLHPPGEPVYDIVSNNNDWKVCKDGEGTKDISLAILDPADVSKANRFYCYKEGNKWSWADCLNSDEAVGPSVNGAKERIQGDGLFALKLLPLEDPAGSDVVSVDMSSYTTSRLDLAGFNPQYLEFYVRFKRLHSANLQLKISGPLQGGQYIPYYDQPVLGYAVNTPLLEENRWIHLKVPLASEMLDVQSLSVESEGNSIEVRNMYLSDGSSRICSGTRSNQDGQSSWLEDLDYSGPSISGKNLCNVLFDPAYETPEANPEYQGKAWLGDFDADLNLNDNNCCGNSNPANEPEYYAGQSRLVEGKYYGCWNSEPIASGSTTMNVEFGVEYAERTSEITYPSIPVDYTLTYLFPGFEETKTASSTVSMTESPKQLEELEVDFTAPTSGDRKWGRIRASGPNHALVNLNLREVKNSFREFSNQVSSVENVIENIELSETSYLPDISGSEATFSTGADTDFWIAWIFVPQDYHTPAKVSMHSELGIAIAQSCNRGGDGGDKYNFDASSCFFSSEAPEFFSDVDYGNNGRYVEWWYSEPDVGIQLKFKKGWNVLLLILDSRGSGSRHFSYRPIFDSFVWDNPSILYFDSHGPQSMYPTGIKVESNQDSPEFDLNLYNLHTGDISDEFTNLQGPQKFAIIAETNKVEVSPPQTETKQKNFNYVCHQSSPSLPPECSYPLPGNQPYTITNSHPDLYELYFVGIGEDGRPLPEKLITPAINRFTTPGSITARRVAQQVVFINEGEDADDVPIFYGCQAADYIEQAPQDQAEFDNLNYCSIKAGKFCAYSVPQEDLRKKFTTINSWSDEQITKVGYDPITEVNGDVNNFYASIELQLRNLRADMPYEEAPIERNHSSSVLPTRNFISNAQFTRSGLVLPHWDIRLADGTEKENLRSNLVNDELHSITLDSDEILRSEQIAVPVNTKLSFSAVTTCTPILNLVDKNGVVTPVAVPTLFNTGTASYLRLEFQGACTLHSPLLQVVDDLPPVPFNYRHQEYPVDGFDARAGVACCPQDYCWNGYACVEPMGSSTYLAEHIADGRDYRCIEGQWKYLPLQFDWNKEKWGFCEQQEQCLVLPSTSGGSAEYTALDFYDGQYPTCINNGEYIFDNLCNKGNWTSRTKYVATKLLEVGENSDYVLYCAPYRQALLEFDNRENYLGGEFVQQSSTAPTLTQTLQGPADPAGLATCFNTIQDPEGRRLVSDEENTCINNVCVLKFKQGGEFKVAFATTVNKDILKEDSFLFALNIPQNRLNQLCTGTGDFVKCDLTGLNIPGDLWYSNTLNATIYGKQGIQITPTMVDRILNWLARFVGVQSELSDESAFISRAQNFRDVYVLSIGDKKVRALKEVLSADKQTLMAEYEHFTTPVCDYVKNIAIPAEAQTEILEQLSGQQKIICSGNATGIQRVEAIAGLDFFWPQLTGRMRVS